LAQWRFTPGKVFMMCLWSFLLGGWIASLAVYLELGVSPQWTSTIFGVVVAGGSLVMWLVWSREKAQSETAEQ
jgi:hypothetical protein